jgi:hypothetical protein
MERKELNKRLFNEARKATAEPWRDDNERVKEVRDMKCFEMYGKSYEELTDAEMEAVINEFMPHGSKKCASPAQLKTLKFYAIICALKYCNLDSLTCKDEEGYEFKGETLRDFLTLRFETKGGLLPMNAFAYLHKQWINPKSHQFLIEGHLRERTKVPERFYYHYLAPHECQYLINRYRAVAEQLQMKITIEEFMSKVTNN